MSERAYTVSEIDRMRRAVRRVVLFGEKWGTPHPEGVYVKHAVRTFQVGEADQITEDRLRTYMMAGIAPEELEYQPPVGESHE